MGQSCLFIVCVHLKYFFSSSSLNSEVFFFSLVLFLASNRQPTHEEEEEKKTFIKTMWLPSFSRVAKIEKKKKEKERISNSYYHQMRLTSQQINDARIILNPEGRLTILLRDLGITEVGNLSITKDQYEVIDLSNNELIKLSNIPSRFKKLEVLLLSNNNILYIDEDTFPLDNQIKSITLYNNNIYKFQPLFKDKFPKLETLVLTGNPITELENYRLFVIWLIPSLKVLDFKKIKQAERVQAEELFGTDHAVFNNEASKLLNATGVTTNTTNISDRQVDNVVKKLTEEEKQELLNKLEIATSIEEIEKIENALKNGIV